MAEAKKEAPKEPKKETKKKAPKVKYWAKTIYIPGAGLCSGEVTQAQKNAFLRKGSKESLEARLVDEDPIAKIKAERELKRKAKLGLK